MKNITIEFVDATVFINKIMKFNIVDYRICINNLEIDAVMYADESGELIGDDIRFYSCNFYAVYSDNEEYEIELSDNYKNFVLDMVRHFHHRVDYEGFSMLEYTKHLVDKGTLKRTFARTISLKHFEEV